MYSLRSRIVIVICLFAYAGFALYISDIAALHQRSQESENEWLSKDTKANVQYAISGYTSLLSVHRAKLDNEQRGFPILGY